jgi:glycolate oxidase iron-sulfur subunit
LKEYGELLRDDPAYADRAAAFAAKVRDLSEVLIELGPVATRHPLPVTIAYHDACHLGHAQGVRAQPRALLRGIPGLELREIADPEICCGSAGIWNVLNPEPAAELGDRKARTVLATGAELAGHRQPGLPHAGRRRRCAARRRDRAWRTPRRSWTPRSAAGRWTSDRNSR